MSAETPEDGLSRLSIGTALDAVVQDHTAALNDHEDLIADLGTRMALVERSCVITTDRLAQLARGLAGQSTDLADFQSALAQLQRRL